MTSPEGEFLGEPLAMERITDLLGVTPAAIRKQLSREKFPQPMTGPGDGPRHWRKSDVYRYALQQGGKAAHRVPRIFSRTAEPHPARFISNTMYEFPYQHLHLLTWLPSDGAGLVALAHPLSAMPHRKAIHDLFAQAQDLSAVAVVRNDLSDGPHGWEASLNIWDRDATDSYIASWSDLLQLLARPLPFWGRGLRQRPAMLAWRPGDPPVALTPVDDHTDTTTIGALLQEVTEPQAHRALQAVIREIRSADTLGAQQDLEMHPEFPGFQHAAVVRSYGSGWDGARTSDLSALLHLCAVSPVTALVALQAWSAHDGIAPLMDMRAQVRPGVTGLAAEWVQRLRPVPTSRERDQAHGQELGHLYLAAARAPQTEQMSTCLHDPEHPDLWVIRQGDTYFYNVPPSMPASGTLVDVSIIEDEHEVAAFFRDSTGTVWPVPSGHSEYNVGYRGSGPYDLTTSLLTLLHDARADLRTTALVQPQSGSWLLRQLTSPTGARAFPAEDITS